MTTPARPLNNIIPVSPDGGRPTVIRSAVRDRDSIFRGWGPKL
jgi:hypothetical protein